MESENINEEKSEIISGSLEDDDSDESMDDVEDAACMKEIEILNKKIENSPYDYQAHVDLISLLRKSGEFEMLTSARKIMANYFPLTQELWLNWLEDDQKFAETEEEHKQIEELFETAVKDYMCPEIWLEYAQYSIRFIGNDGGIEKMRNILERALSAVGLHVCKGSSLWEAYREIENAILVTLQPAPGSISTPEDNDRIMQQCARIGSLFSRQLAVPLLDMEETMKEYLEWRKTAEDGDVPLHIEEAYNKALKALEELKTFEKLLEDGSADSNIETYESYIAHERKSNDPARIQCVYERAIADHCLNSSLWSQYLKYMSGTLKTGPVVLSVHERAVRNCPWTSEFWQKYLLVLERQHAGYEKLKDVVNEALQVGFSTSADYAQLWLIWCDVMRRHYCESDDKDKDEVARQLRGEFERATSHLLNTVLPAFNSTGDPNYALWCYWARCEAGCLSNMKKSRQIMEKFLEEDVEARRKWEIWKEYYDLERLHGDVEHARAVLRHAVQSTAADDGSAEYSCLFYIRFERENGSLDDLDEATKKVESRLAKVQKRKEKIANQTQEKRKRWEQNGQVHKKWSKDGGKSPRERKGIKRISEQDAKLSNIPKKRLKTETSSEKDLQEAKEEFKAPINLPIRFVKSAPKPPKASSSPVKVSITSPPSNFQRKTETNPTKQSINERNSESEERTVFVSNLSYDLESIEDKLKQTFSPCGDVTSVRLVRSNKGNFRGYAYVEFAEKASVEDALKLDRQPLEGRPIFVSPNIDKSKHPNFKVFKYSKGMEKHKLFVSGLSFDTTEDSLREVFSPHGDIKSLRIVTARNGKSKGLAYVEYASESTAAQAVLKTDGNVLDGFTMKVAISNPPTRNIPGEKLLGRGGKPIPAGGRGRSRTQVSLLPRSLTKSSAASNISKHEDIQESGAKSLSNQDFSKLFSKTK